jgi:hypothetical protein
MAVLLVWEIKDTVKPVKRGSIHMKLSMIRKNKDDLLIQMAA